jgi:serine/threonine-protein kinase
MQGERWRQVDKLFHDIIDQTPEQRAAFLEQICANDPSLKKEVEQLIEAYKRSGNFLDSTGAAYGSLIGRSLGSYKVEALPWGWRHQHPARRIRTGFRSRKPISTRG